MEYTIKAGKICLADDLIKEETITIADGVITSIGGPASGQEIDLGAYTLLPGLIDIHVHGGGGFDVMDASEAAIESMSLYKLKEGVTSFCPTTVTASLDGTYHAIDAVRRVYERGGKNGAKILGVFLEGPYINLNFKGAHPEKSIREIDYSELMNLADQANFGKPSVMIAPEKPGALAAIKALDEKGICVRLGHTGGTYEQIIQGVDAGGSIAVHTYNAMTPLGSRQPGAVGAFMNDDRAYCEVICDTIHVHPAAIQVLQKQKGWEKMVLVTDCMRAGGIPDGVYLLGEMEAVVKNGIARTKDGALAGSTLRLNQAVYNYHKIIGGDLSQAVAAASLNPARALGADNEIGSIALGKRGDLIGVDAEMNVHFVMIDGEIVL